MIKLIPVKHSLFLLSALLCTNFIYNPSNSQAAEYQFTYPVTGSTAKELMSQIKNNSDNPEGAFGYTKLSTNVEWTAVVDGDGVCSIETVDFTYDISIFMPDWTDKHRGKQCLQRNWMEVWLDIQVHEERHRELYRLLDARNIEQRIATIKPQASCDALNTVVNKEVEKILDANDKLHDQFHASDVPPTLWEC